MPQYSFDINAAMQAGYKPEQIQAYLAQQKAKGNDYQLTPTPQATPQQSQVPVQPQRKSNFIADALPTVGAVVGGMAGAAIPFLGETGIGEIGGSAAGSALGETAKELLTGQPLSGRDIATQGVVGGVGGAIGKGASFVAGKVLPKVADSAATRLMNGVYKEPIKATKAAMAGGESLGKQALNRGEVGTTRQLYDKATTQIGNSEEQLQNILMGASKKVDISDVENEVAPLVQKYMQSGNTEAANAITNRIAAIKAQNGDKIPAALANQIKRALYDEADKAYGQQSTAGMEGIKAIARGFKNSIEGVDPQVQQINKDLSYYGRARNSMLDKMTRDERNAVLGLTDSIAGGAGLTTAGLPGAVAGVVTKKALGSTLAKTVAAQAINTLPKTPQMVGNAVTQASGQAAARSFLPVGAEQANQSADNNSNYQSQDNNNLPPSPDQAFGGNSTTNNPQSQANQPSSLQPPANFMAGYTVNGQPISDADKNMIYQIVNYRLDPTKMTSLRNNERERIISLASQFDPSYDSSQFPAKAALRKDFTSGKSAQNIRSLNTAISHLNALAQDGSALGNTPFTPYNQLKNGFSQATGHPEVTRFNDALNAVSGEMAQVFKNSGATDEEIRSWKEQMSAAQSPEQIQAGINQMVELMAGRLQALQSQYQTGMGKPADFTFLNPNSQAILQSWGVDPTQLSNPNSLPANP